MHRAWVRRLRKKRVGRIVAICAGRRRVRDLVSGVEGVLGSQREISC